MTQIQITKNNLKHVMSDIDAMLDHNKVVTITLQESSPKDSYTTLMSYFSQHPLQSISDPILFQQQLRNEREDRMYRH